MKCSLIDSLWNLGFAGLLTAATLAIKVGSLNAAEASSDQMPDYAPFTQSYHVPFTRPVNFNHLEGMHVRVTLNGGPPTSFLVDTGSTGVVVAADEVPDIEPNAPAGDIKYSSSGVELDGVWTKVTLTFPDSKDAQGRVATAVVPVLAVREKKVSGVGVNAAKQKPSLNPKVHMFGIGFGRGKEAHPEKNPFVNLAEMRAGTMRRGYTITRDGFTLGLTAEKLGPGYLYQKLTERTVSAATKAMRPGLKDWETAPGSMTVGAFNAPMGTVLMDTGLTNMMLAAADSGGEGDVPPGTLVTINLLGGKLHYTFKAGDPGNPLTPRKITWVRPTHGTFVNTGLRALAGFDYLYDADGGYFGLRPVGASK
jgi:hypothetical protein